MICDFCGIDDPTWLYENKSFHLRFNLPNGRPMEFESKGGSWASCDLCSNLIEEENLKGLASRATEFYLQIYLSSRGMSGLQDFLFKLFIEFQKSRISPRRKINDTPNQKN